MGASRWLRQQEWPRTGGVLSRVCERKYETCPPPWAHVLLFIKFFKVSWLALSSLQKREGPWEWNDAVHSGFMESSLSPSWTKAGEVERTVSLRAEVISDGRRDGTPAQHELPSPSCWIGQPPGARPPEVGPVHMVWWVGSRPSSWAGDLFPF